MFLVWREGGCHSDEFLFNIHARFSSIEYPQKYLYVIYFSPTTAKELMIVTNFPIGRDKEDIFWLQVRVGQFALMQEFHGVA